MIVETTNGKIFWKVYNKLLIKIEHKIKKFSIQKKYGGTIDHNQLKELNLFIHYLESIKDSNFTYYYIENLTQISNYLNRI